ncbi:MAG: hypothetical protein C6Y22_22155 [Hapalosiphonaceae cyanobacterium JJU2]|nr:MAG: hypothetical protein C6Y22_22155 [Hapalosiphonaceae cyanobacterium JJU2]
MEEPIVLNDDDVVCVSDHLSKSFQGGTFLSFGAGSTFTVDQLKTGMRIFIQTQAKNEKLDPRQDWFMDDGVQCKILRPKGCGWQKGTVRFSLEFIPEDSSLPSQENSSENVLSPLDEFGSQIEQINK